jgi:hypothetical protein
MPATIGRMTPQESEQANIAIDYLRRFVAEAAAFFLECQERPTPRSAVGRAHRNRDLVLVLDASLLHDAAGDFFTAIVNEFVHGPLPRFSLYTVVRGALEADAWTCWLLEPSIDDTKRLERVLTLRSSSLFEMKRLGLSPTTTSPARHYLKRIKRVRAAGKRWKLTRKTHKHGLETFVEMPKVTPLLRSLLPQKSAKNKQLTVGEQTYGELSARAHGTTWALLSNITPVARLSRFRQMGYSELDVTESLRLLGVAIHLHDQATARMAELAGIDPVDWQKRRGDLPWAAAGGPLTIPPPRT